jgi:HlyD family secretion protein
MKTACTFESYGACLMAAALLAACAKTPETAWSGYAEGDYVYVAAPVSGTLAELTVQRGQEIKQGTLLFKLEDAVERAARTEAAARLATAQAQAANTEKGRRPDEIAVTQAQLAQAKAQAASAASELTRQEKLVAQGFIAPSRLDDARALAQQTAARVAELNAALRVAKLPAREDERSAAAATAQAAKATFDQAKWREDQKQQSALADARVADTFFRPGEWVNAGQPVLALLPPNQVHARFFVPQTELGAIKPGDPVSISCDSCGAPIAARISFIATQAEYTPPVIYSNSQRARLVFMVLAQPEAKEAGRLKPGQPVDIRRAAAS